MASKRMKVYKDRKFRLRPLLIPLGIAAALAAVGLMWWHDAGAGNRKPHTLEITLTSPEGAPAAGREISPPVDFSTVPISEWGRLKPLRTDENGRVSFENVLPGSYWISEGLNWHAVSIPVSAPGRVKASFTTAMDAYSATLRILDPSGNPVSAQSLRVYPNALQASGKADPISLTTDWQGNAVWENAPTGGHQLEIGGLRIPFVLEPNEKKSLRINFTWSPASGSAYGQTLRFSRGNGKPLADQPVEWTLYGVPGGTEFVYRTFQTNSKGEISVDGLWPGEHTFRINGNRFRLNVPHGESPAANVTDFRL